MRSQSPRSRRDVVAILHPRQLGQPAEHAKLKNCCCMLTPASAQNVSANFIYERRSPAASRRMYGAYWSPRPGRDVAWQRVNFCGGLNTPSHALLSGTASLRLPLAGLLENASGPAEDVLLGREDVWKTHCSMPRQQSR